MKSRLFLTAMALAIVLLAVGGWLVGAVRPSVARPDGTS
jgi:hypothetical protein